MQQMHEPPIGPAAGPRRARTDPPPVRVPEPGESTEAYLAALQTAMTARLEEGLQALHRSAARLLKQVAAEAWKASKEARPGSPDAARSVLSYVDERYQSLGLAIGRLEDTVTKLARSTGDVLLRADRTGEMVERVVRAAQEQGRMNEAALAELAQRIRHLLEPLAARMEAIEAALSAATAGQRRDLETFSKRTGEGLARVGERLREGFAAMAERTAAESAEALARLEAAVGTEVGRLEGLARELLDEGARRAEDTADPVDGFAGRVTAARPLEPIHDLEPAEVEAGAPTEIDLDLSELDATIADLDGLAAEPGPA